MRNMHLTEGRCLNTSADSHMRRGFIRLIFAMLLTSRNGFHNLQGREKGEETQ